MARKKLAEEGVSVKVVEELQIGDSKMYVVKSPFKGTWNTHVFNARAGDTVVLNADEYATYKRFLKE